MSARRPSRAAVRIQAGRWKGQRLEASPRARPTSGRARKALFDLLRGRLPNARVLDLFAGTGAVGLEAVSQGASRSVLVESDPRALGRSLARIGVSQAEARVIEGGAASAIEALIREGARFEIIFADPPYGDASGGNGMDRVARLLTEDGVLVFQRDRGSPPPRVPGLRFLRRRGYGRNVFHFFGML